MHTEIKNISQRSQRFEARMTEYVKTLCQEAAALEGRTLTDFVVSSAFEAARKTIEHNEYLILSRRDRLAFYEALMKPAPPNEHLREAFKLHDRVVIDSE